MTGEGDPLDGWKAWLETIQQDVWRMHVGRTIWRRFIDILNANPALQERGTFAEWATSNYASAQVMAIRRQVDAGSDAVSLRRLLTELEAQPETITRERFVRINFQSGEGMAAHLWPNFADPTGQHLSPAMVRADLDELLRTADIVRRYATNRIAHWLEQDWTEPVTYEDLHTSVDAVGKLLERYSGLLTGATQAADPICRWVETRSSGSRSSNGSAATARSLRELPELLTSTTGEAQLPSGKRTIEVVLAQPNHDDTDTTASVTVNVTGGGSQTGTCAAPESWSCRILAAG